MECARPFPARGIQVPIAVPDDHCCCSCFCRSVKGSIHVQLQPICWRGSPFHRCRRSIHFFQWADPDSDSFVVEFGKMKKCVDSLKLRSVVAHRRCKAAIMFGLLGWLICFSLVSI
ncbi:hypothetical protein PIB30_056339 [Stylosanthes scabra]|uniref:Zinc finger GRF-type domain-containing protein n=1 Tax=Stylosanthes scabra TaxID=79078 RepID=A0ABU6VKC2_9FABA|nr:hypothetical protein [Stylosanthes scabra]